MDRVFGSDKGQRTKLASEKIGANLGDHSALRVFVVICQPCHQVLVQTTVGGNAKAWDSVEP
jgi:hypothetical protein